jgi:hypothetical protein
LRNPDSALIWSSVKMVCMSQNLILPEAVSIDRAYEWSFSASNVTRKTALVVATPCRK